MTTNKLTIEVSKFFMQLEPPSNNFVWLEHDALINMLFQHIKGLDLFTLFRVSKSLNTKLEIISKDAWKHKIESEYEQLPSLDVNWQIEGQEALTSWKRIYYLIHSGKLARIDTDGYKENLPDIRNRLIIANHTVGITIHTTWKNFSTWYEVEFFNTICQDLDLEFVKICYENQSTRMSNDCWYDCISTAYEAHNDSVCLYLIGERRLNFYDINKILLHACEDRDLSFIKEILKFQHVDVNYSDDENKYIIDVAIRSNNPEVAEFIYNYPGALHEYKHLKIACEVRCIPIIRKALSELVINEEQCKDLLYSACSCGHSDVVAALLQDERFHALKDDQTIITMNNERIAHHTTIQKLLSL